MRRDPPGPICPARRTSPAMLQVKLVDLPCIFGPFLKALSNACHSKVLQCKLLCVALS